MHAQAPTGPWLNAKPHPSITSHQFWVCRLLRLRRQAGPVFQSLHRCTPPVFPTDGGLGLEQGYSDLLGKPRSFVLCITRAISERYTVLYYIHTVALPAGRVTESARSYLTDAMIPCRVRPLCKAPLANRTAVPCAPGKRSMDDERASYLGSHSLLTNLPGAAFLVYWLEQLALQTTIQRGLQPGLACECEINIGVTTRSHPHATLRHCQVTTVLTICVCFRLG